MGCLTPLGIRFRWSPADHDVESGRQRADLRVLDRLEIDEDQLAVDGVARAPKDAIGLVAGMAGDEELGGQQLAVALLDLDVNVRAGRPGYGTGLMVRKRYSPFVSVVNRPKPWKFLSCLASLPTAVGGVQVHRLGVALPDLDDGVVDRRAVGLSTRPVRCVISPMAGVIELLTMIRSLSVSSGSLSG